MKYRYLSLFLLVFLIGCHYFDYQRTQELPKGVRKVSEKKLCSFGSYEAYEIKLSEIINVTITKWNKGLICEGYSDKPMRLDWIKMSNLSIQNEKSLDYFVEKLESCKFKVNRDLYVSACRTEYNAPKTDGSKSFNYHRVYFLNTAESIMVEVVNLD